MLRLSVSCGLNVLQCCAKAYQLTPLHNMLLGGGAPLDAWCVWNHPRLAEVCLWAPCVRGTLFICAVYSLRPAQRGSRDAPCWLLGSACADGMLKMTPPLFLMVYHIMVHSSRQLACGFWQHQLSQA